MSRRTLTIPLAGTSPEAEDFSGSLSPPPPVLVRDTPVKVPAWKQLPIIISALVAAGALFPAPALTDGLSGNRVPGAALLLSPAYLIFAPVCDTLDTISMFSQKQHFAFLLTCAAVYVIWRLIRRRETVSPASRLRKEGIAASLAVAALMVFYVAGALLPRPTARLAMSSPDEAVIDFHSHTRYSWDGLSSFSPERSRRWHQENGFNVAYVTDHSTFAGAEEAALHNPARAGSGTVMLSGIEVRDRGAHLAVLGTSAADWRAYPAGNLDEGVFARLKGRGINRPAVLLTLPGSFNSLSALSSDGIELFDAAPRGLSQSDTDRERIAAVGRDNRLGLVASSNNHGWAGASPAWSVMQIRGWRLMTPAQLDSAIRQRLILDGPAAVRVVSRRVRGAVSPAGFAMTVPAAAWRLLRTMSWWERTSWLAWVWVFSFAAPIRAQLGRWRRGHLRLAA